MEEQGIICGYPTLINWDKTGCEHVTALIEVTVAPERGRGFDKVAEGPSLPISKAAFS